MPSRDRSFHANFGMLPQWVQKLESSRRFEGLISDPIRDMLQVDADLRMQVGQVISLITILLA